MLTKPDTSPHSSLKQSPTCFGRSEENRLWRTLSRLYRPTCEGRAKTAEEELLRRAGLPVDDPSRFRQERTVLGDGRDPHRYMNTVILDEGGLEAPLSERTAVVMVNGLGAALGVFFMNLGPVSQSLPRARVYAPDWLGTGRSGRPAYPSDPVRDPPEAGIRFFLDAFEEWRDAHGIDRFVLVGHSLGGYLSTLYALQHPNRVLKLILASPAGLPQDKNCPEIEEAMGGTIAVNGQLVPAWIAWMWARNHTPMDIVRWAGPLGPSIVHAYVRRRLPGLPSAIIDIFAEYMYHVTAHEGSGEYALGTLMRPGAWAKLPLHDRLHQLAMPVTFVYGADDWMDHRYAEACAVMMRVPVKILQVPDAGHQLYLEQPEAFNRIVAEECLDFHRVGVL